MAMHSLLANAVNGASKLPKRRMRKRNRMKRMTMKETTILMKKIPKSWWI